MVRRLTISLLFVVLGFMIARGQEMQFSQYYAASLYLNPAFAGIYSSPNLSLNYRQQQPGTSIKNQMMQASFVFPILNENDFDNQIGGVGVTGFSYQRGIGGVEKVSGYMLSYAHDIRFSLISPDLLSLGLQVGMDFVSVAYSDLAWGSQFSPYLTSGTDPNASPPNSEFDARGSNLVVNGGLIYYYNRQRNYLLYNYSAFSGFSVTNLNRPDKSLSKDNKYIAPLFYKYHGAFEFRLQGMYLMPSVLLTYSGRKTFQANGGFYLSYPTNVSRGFSLDSRGLELLAGVWYRYQDSFIFIVGFNDDSIGARVSYDLNQNVIFPERIQGAFLDPAFEVSLQYNLNSGSRMRKVSNPLF